jgi:hypothetical protein
VIPVRSRVRAGWGGCFIALEVANVEGDRDPLALSLVRIDPVAQIEGNIIISPSFGFTVTPGSKQVAPSIERADPLMRGSMNSKTPLFSSGEMLTDSDKS